MWVCKLCGAEYERHADRSIVCRPCHDRVRALPSQALTIGERLWGKSYEKNGCWEFNTPGPDGRAGKIMQDKRQRPAPQVALILAGVERPSEKHVVRATCENKMCVRPDHLAWVEWRGGAGPAWAHGLSQADAVELLDAGRAARARYQRNYRARLRSHGVYSMRELAERARAREPEPRSAVPEAAPAATPSLLDSLQGAKIAPVD